MLLGAGLVLAGAAVLYFAVTGTDPRTLLGPPGRATAATGAPTPPGSGGASGGTPAVQAALGVIRSFVAARYPSSQLMIGSVYRPGAIVAGTTSASEHGGCMAGLCGNAIDLRILTSTGALDRVAMDGLYNFLKLAPYCELCWSGQGGCTTSHDDHLHYAPLPCLAG